MSLIKSSFCFKTHSYKLGSGVIGHVGCNEWRSEICTDSTPPRWGKRLEGGASLVSKRSVPKHVVKLGSCSLDVPYDPKKWVAAAIFVELSVKDVTWNQIDEF